MKNIDTASLSEVFAGTNRSRADDSSTRTAHKGGGRGGGAGRRVAGAALCAAVGAWGRGARRRQKGGSSDVLSRVRVLSRFPDFFSMCFMNHHVRRGCLCDRIASDPTQGIEV